MKNCIACAEEIKSAALLCKHCGTRQDDSNFIQNYESPIITPSELDLLVAKKVDEPKGPPLLDEIDLDLSCPSCMSLISSKWLYCDICGVEKL